VNLPGRGGDYSTVGISPPDLGNFGTAMSARTVPHRINDFLVERKGRSYCDACIQERLGLKWRQQVQLITATLAVTEGYERGLDQCSTCQETKQVIQARVGVQSAPARKAASAVLSMPRSDTAQDLPDEAEGDIGRSGTSATT
jgi:hypothetical protein